MPGHIKPSSELDQLSKVGLQESSWGEVYVRYHGEFLPSEPSGTMINISKPSEQCASLVSVANWDSFRFVPTMLRRES